ncbi:MAG TPA: hypothetical protein VJC05_03115 [Candidatus Andersenbacteria bacterium]|nr:hypothetical protein [Candidatus Andersenbacteria bacterium]
MIIDLTEQINQGQIALGVMIIAFALTIIALNLRKKPEDHKKH